MTNRIPFALLFAAALLPACSSAETACTLEASASLSVKVIDDKGVVVPDAKVTFSLNGGALQSAECVQPVGGGGGSCAEWTAGVEEAGMFDVKATSADGTKKAEQSITVAQGKCHVIQQQATLTLK